MTVSLARVCLRGLSKLVKRSPKVPHDPFAEDFKELVKTASGDLSHLGWQFREITENGLTKEIELLKQSEREVLCIKARPLAAYYSQKSYEEAFVEAQTKKYSEIAKARNLMTSGDQAGFEALNKEFEADKGPDFDEANFIQTSGLFVLGRTTPATDSALIAVCQSKMGELSVKNILASSDKALIPAFDGKPLIDAVLADKRYKGPQVRFLDAHLQLLLNHYFEGLGINRDFLLTLELVSGGYRTMNEHAAGKVLNGLKSLV